MAKTTTTLPDGDAQDSASQSSAAIRVAPMPPAKTLQIKNVLLRAQTHLSACIPSVDNLQTGTTNSHGTPTAERRVWIRVELRTELQTLGTLGMRSTTPSTETGRWAAVSVNGKSISSIVARNVACEQRLKTLQPLCVAPFTNTADGPRLPLTCLHPARSATGGCGPRYWRNDGHGTNTGLYTPGAAPP